jgi:hypothetical protein
MRALEKNPFICSQECLVALSSFFRRMSDSAVGDYLSSEEDDVLI